MPPFPTFCPWWAKTMGHLLRLEPARNISAITSSAASSPERAPAQGSRIFATPLARRLAKREAIDLSRLQGTGPHGRILARDVAAAQPNSSWIRASAVASDMGAPEAAFPALRPKVHLDVPHATVPHSPMRRTIAERLTASERETQHVHLTSHCELEALLTLRAELNRARTEAERLTINDFILRAAAVALLRVPDCNVMWSTDVLVRLHRADIAVAVATDGGLITPVLRDAGAKSLTAIASEVKVLAEKARGKGLATEDHRGGSLTVSNLGMFGVSQFAAIVNPPQAAILAVGAAEERLRLVAGEVRAVTSMTVTLSVDHRAIDGAVAAKWLHEFKALVETPLTMLV